MAEGQVEYTAVRIKIDPYCHKKIQSILLSASREFGRDRSRWYWKHEDVDAWDSESNNVWNLKFFFKDPHDANMFCLKYLE